jgi:Cft2 family RNA processing exonuclease
MQITFLGGADGIGASCAVVDFDDARLLIDCGQRLGAEVGHALPDFSFLEDGRAIDAILLTHAHADHLGALPALESHLPATCPVYANDPTLSLAHVMLEDSARIMGQHRSGDGELPLFPTAAVRATVQRFRSVRWGKTMRLDHADVWATWFPAGHILGAAMIEVRDARHSVLFTGDISVADQISVPGVFAPAIRPDVLVLESTYGNRLHAHRPHQERRIVERIRDCLQTGGSVLFPTFAVGRAQEVLLLLGRAMRERQLDPVPVFADGLVRAVCRVYSRFPGELSPNCRRLWEHGLDPLFPEDLPIRPVRNDSERRQLVAAGKPCVVVASSGMLQGGASQFYARNWIDNDRNLILVTGYQDEESPGQALLDLVAAEPNQPRSFKLGGVRVDVRCRVESCLLSAHADACELIALASKMHPRQVLLVHGDPAARAGLARGLASSISASVELPANGQSCPVRSSPRIVRAAEPSGRPNPLAQWPPWDPLAPRPLDLPRFHAWIVEQQPRVSWVTIDELAEIWKSPQPISRDDWVEIRRAVYEQPQPCFVPDSKRPHILRVTPASDLVARRAGGRLPVEAASAVVRQLFPQESGLARFGFFPEDGRVQLEFRFPRAAERNYAQRMGELIDRTGWVPDLNRQTADADLVAEIEAWLAPSCRRTIRIRHEAGAVDLTTSADQPFDDVDVFVERFERRTGYRLELVITGLAD